MKNLKVSFFIMAVFSAAAFLGSVKSVHAQSSSFEWRGTVDDVVEIRIRDRDADTRTISGQETYDSSYNFDGRGGGRGGRNRRERGNASVEKQDGRGRVFVVQQPNRRNNWTTVIQIVDSKGGSDRYRFNVYWN